MEHDSPTVFSIGAYYHIGRTEAAGKNDSSLSRSNSVGCVLQREYHVAHSGTSLAWRELARCVQREACNDVYAPELANRAQASLASSVKVGYRERLILPILTLAANQ